MKNNIIKNAFLHASTTALYVAAVASFLFYAPKVFEPQRADTVLIPIAMLLLFVFSAAITGVSIFGRPILWYLDGKKQEAISLLLYTLGFFLIITIIALSALFFFYR
ncbi:hypothetical protein HYV91_00645 [Candidatus Wolfebacteria bacterium]|nr:hypothetical protein [Candidatus Wolfebacteria bacterium]